MSNAVECCQRSGVQMPNPPPSGYNAWDTLPSPRTPRITRSSITSPDQISLTPAEEESSLVRVVCGFPFPKNNVLQSESNSAIDLLKTVVFTCVMNGSCSMNESSHRNRNSLLSATIGQQPPVLQSGRGDAAVSCILLTDQQWPFPASLLASVKTTLSKKPMLKVIDRLLLQPEKCITASCGGRRVGTFLWTDRVRFGAVFQKL